MLLIGYELFLTSREITQTALDSALTLAGPAELERFYAHLEETLAGIGFLTGDQAPSILISLRRLFGRANLEPRDVKILRGILGQMDWYRKNASGPVLQSERREAGTPRQATEDVPPEGSAESGAGSSGSGPQHRSASPVAAEDPGATADTPAASTPEVNTPAAAAGSPAAAASDARTSVNTRAPAKTGQAQGTPEDMGVVGATWPQDASNKPSKRGA